MGRKDQAHDTRPRYKGICPACGGDLYICKSIAQEIGLAPFLGHGTCPKCGKFLHLAFNEERQEFDCEAWEEYMKKAKGGFGDNGN